MNERDPAALRSHGRRHDAVSSLRAGDEREQVQHPGGWVDAVDGAGRALGRAGRCG
jgi:hypothetical protein